MKAVSSILVAAMPAMCYTSVEANGLLGGLTSVLGGGDGASPFGPISIVGSPAIDVDTNVGSPTTVIDKAASKGGINIVTPSFVRVKTNVDSEKTEIKTAQSSGAVPSPPSTPFGVAGSYQPGAVRPDSAVADPDIVAALSPSRPKPTSVAALASVLSSFLGGAPPATPAPAPLTLPPQTAAQTTPTIAPTTSVAAPTASITTPTTPVMAPAVATPPAPVAAPPQPVMASPTPTPTATAPPSGASKLTPAPGVSAASSLYVLRG